MCKPSFRTMFYLCQLNLLSFHASIEMQTKLHFDFGDRFCIQGTVKSCEKKKCDYLKFYLKIISDGS